MTLCLFLIIFNGFSQISGYKVNWSKSALLPLKLQQDSWPQYPILIQNFKYVGVSILPSISKNCKVLETDGSRLTKMEYSSNIILRVPNFQWHHWSFLMHPSSIWLNPASQMSWWPVEDLTLKHSQEKLGSILTKATSTWHHAEKHCNILTNLTSTLPFSIIIISNWEINQSNFLNWVVKGCTLLVTSMVLMMEWCVLENTSPHTCISQGSDQPQWTGLKTINFVLNKASCMPLTILWPWKTDLSPNSSNLNLDIQLSSRNPNHQVINFNVMHWTYFSSVLKNGCRDTI